MPDEDRIGIDNWANELLAEDDAAWRERIVHLEARVAELERVIGDSRT